MKNLFLVFVLITSSVLAQIVPGGMAIQGPPTATDNAIVRFDGTTGRRAQNSVLIVADTTGALSGFTTGAGITWHGGGTITGASGSLDLTASGTNQSIALTPSGTGWIAANGAVVVNTSLSAHKTSSAVMAFSSGTNQIYSYGANAGTAGQFNFRCNSSDGSIALIPLNFSAAADALFTPTTFVRIAGTKVLSFGATANATIGVSADTTAGILTITGPSAGSVAIKGTVNADAAAAGNVGELLSAQLAAASATSLTTATGKTVTSVSLTAGDWEVSGTVHFIPANTTVVASLVASVSATDNTQASADSVGGYASIGAVYTSGGATMSATPIPTRISLAATTTYYLVATGTFSVSTCTAYGTIRARRIR